MNEFKKLPFKVCGFTHIHGHRLALKITDSKIGNS